MADVIRTRGVHKRFRNGEVDVHALKGVDLTIKEGQLVVILGPSGSGKSTMLNVLGGMDSPTEGEIYYRGKFLHGMSKSELTIYRRNAIRFVFQFYNLIPNLTAFENVALATEIAENPLDPVDTLMKVGLSDRIDHFPAQMSGGQQQRVAIARAVAKNPDILLCDEPTGALDFETGRQVLDVLQTVNTEMGKTVIIITHNAEIAQMANVVLHFRDGVVERTEENENPVSAREVTW